MTNEKRKFTRFDIPVIIQFKPAKESSEYSWGLTKNLSCEGFSFEALNLDFEPEETLELKLKFPQRGTFISVLGDIVWKRQVSDKYWAGIKLKDMDKEAKSEFLEKISSHGNVPVDWFLYGKDHEGMMRKRIEEYPVVELHNQKEKQNSLEKSENTGIKKQYLDTSSTCRVTFRLPKDAAPDAQQVTIVGDFNSWDKEETFMNKLESGDFTVTLELKLGREYKFRYLIDGDRWENDSCPDKYVPNSFGWHDSVVVV